MAPAIGAQQQPEEEGAPVALLALLADAEANGGRVDQLPAGRDRRAGRAHARRSAASTGRAAPGRIVLRQV